MGAKFEVAHVKFGNGQVIERGNRFYWIRGGAEHGPYPTPIDAIADMEADDLIDFEDDETDEADFGVGAAAWVESGSFALRFED